MKKTAASFALLLLLTACSIPVMKLDHIAGINSGYPRKGVLVVQSFEDKRPPEEKTGGSMGTVFSTYVMSGVTEPGMTAYLQEAIKREAMKTGIFQVSSTTGEFVLSGTIKSMKVEKSYGGLIIIPLFRSAINEATIDLHIVLQKNGVTVLEKDVKVKDKDTFWAMTEFTMGGMSEKSADFLDKTLTTAIEDMFDIVKAQVAYLWDLDRAEGRRG